MARTKDLTQGNPGRLIFFFCLPLIIGNLFQQLYTLVDVLVIGRIEGVTQLAAVSSAGWLHWMVLAMGMGIAQGFAIQIAQSFGAGDLAGLRKAVAQSLLLAGGLAILLLIGIQILLRTILTWLHTPPETFALTELYLRILFSGLPLSIGYNLFAGFLRSLGNSRSPFIAMIISSAVNVTLDVLFVAVFRWSVAGVGLATVFSQGISCLVCLIPLFRMKELKLTREDFRPDRRVAVRLLSLGVPLAAQNTIISIGGLIMQSIVNTYGLIFMAGFNAASQMQSLVELAGVSLGSALTAFAGQNIGAGRLDRVKQGLRSSIWICLLMSAIVALLLVFRGTALLRLFIDDQPEIVEQVVSIGYQFMLIMAACLPALYLLFVYRSTLQGLGDTFIPMLSGAVELVLRLCMIFILPLFIGQLGIFWAETSAWIGGMLFNLAGYYWRIAHPDSLRAAHASA